jgi:hypothetical protein
MIVKHTEAGWEIIFQASAGHSNVCITSICLHVAVEEEGLGSLFG